ncbi:MAG TPA: hypothetical protein VFJ58_15835 [Armatimonadota bacterium]|nr:hypothetical protein [Armatimonadota bacterium]
MDDKGTGIYELSLCCAWNNTFNGAPLLMAVGGSDPNQAVTLKEGRDFYNEKPEPDY